MLRKHRTGIQDRAPATDSALSVTGLGLKTKSLATNPGRSMGNEGAHCRSRALYAARPRLVCMDGEPHCGSSSQSTCHLKPA